MSKRISTAFHGIVAFSLLGGFLADPPLASSQSVMQWSGEWLKIGFKKSSVNFIENISGGPPKDGISTIDKPRFMMAATFGSWYLAPTEPVIGVIINGKASAYPL